MPEPPVRFPAGSLAHVLVCGEGVTPIAGPDLSLPSAPPSNAGIEYFRGGDFPLESGKVVPGLTLCYETWGKMDRFRSNVIVLCHGCGRDHTSLGYLIGPGRAFDPERFCIIAMDALGAGRSSSPSTSGLGPTFPHYTIRDMVRAQCLGLTDGLGLTHVRCVAGTSMGGHMALEWAVNYPAIVRSVACVVSASSCPPHLAMINHVLRTAVTADTDWRGGNYKAPPVRGLEAAACATFPWSYGQEWYLQYADEALRTAHLRSAVNRCLALDANDLVYASLAGDGHDVAAPFGGDLASALGRCHMPVLVMPCATDLLLPPWHGQLMHRLLPRGRYVEIPSYAGHGAWAREPEFVAHHLREFIEGRPSP